MVLILSMIIIILFHVCNYNVENIPYMHECKEKWSIQIDSYRKMCQNRISVSVVEILLIYFLFPFQQVFVVEHYPFWLSLVFFGWKEYTSRDALISFLLQKL